MTVLPSGLDLPSAETSAFGLVRGLKGHSRSWSDLVAHAQLVMSYYQELPTDQITRLYDISEASPLVAASRILDAVSMPESELPESERQDWALLGLLAFGMWGNFLSASAVKTRLTPSTLSRPITAAIVATCTPQLAHDFQQIANQSSSATAYLRKLLKFLRTGHSNDATDLEQLLMNCIVDADPFESAMLRSARIVLRQVVRLSALAAITPFMPSLGADYGKRLFNAGVRVLLPPQYKAIQDASLPQSSWNSLVALHTSAGKTLLGELCLLASLDEGPGLAVYLAPYIALGRQVADGLRRHAPSSVRVHTLVGGFRAEESLDPQSQRELVVATPERFDAIMRKSPELFSRLRCIVVDEAHLLGSGIRGIRLEGLLARLKMCQGRGQSVRTVLLSAVTNSYIRLQEWLSIPDKGVITDEWRPTARRLAIWERDGNIRWFRGPEVVRPQKSSNSDVLGTRLLPWPNVNFYAATNFGWLRKQAPDAIENVAVLAEYLWRDFRDVCLCVCMSKHTTRQLAWRLARRLPKVEPLPEQLQRTIDLILNAYPHLHLLAFCCRRGVAYHNASLPHDVRSGLEDAANNRDLRVITATTTLAEGVDLPFRTTVLVDWLSWQGDKEGPMSPLLFRNIAGRCGRAGRQTEGDTIIYDNPVGDPGFTFDPNRGNLQRKLFIEDISLEVQSVFEVTKAGTEFSDDVISNIASQFLAAIPENPDQDDLVSAFSESLYWSTAPDQAAKAQNVIKTVASSILDGSKGALAVAASPFKLTDFGCAAVTSGFSPSSCRAIMTLFSEALPSGGRPALIGWMIVELGQLPEQSNRNWRKEVQKPNRSCRVKTSDAQYAVEGWLSGKSLLDIFVDLPGVKKSKSKVTVSEWLEGLDEPVQWDEDFDAFVDWVNTVIASFASWLMRSCSELSAQTDGWALQVDWGQLSDFCECGVDTNWAVKALRENAPAGREVLAALGRAVFDGISAPNDPLGVEKLQAILATPTGNAKMEKAIRGCFPSNERQQQSAIAVIEWLKASS